MEKSIAEIKRMEQEIKQRLLFINPKLNEQSGIYFLTRKDEQGIKYAYIGQAKHILSRLAQHMTGYQHIDLSLKKHGLISNSNMCGWNVNFLNFPEKLLDEKEQYYIKKYALGGYQLRNKTAGGQGFGKKQIDDYRPGKTYRQGVEQGMKNASRDVAKLFEKHLNVSAKNDPPTVNQMKAMDKFEKFLELSKDDSGGN
jgi:hypothetical protein|nr:MAG TPA: GIY-YIG nuclease superfamily protein [Caudoviricetes sp.]